MQSPKRRLCVVYGHILDNLTSRNCDSWTHLAKPSLAVHPVTCLVDEKIEISVSGLAAGQVVTLTSFVEEDGNRFEARGVYRASKDGTIDNKRDPSIAGTFKGVEAMGLFWSMRPTRGQDQWVRLIKKNVETPIVSTISIFDGSHAGDADICQPPLATATVHRLYKSPSVRRKPVVEGPFRGTIFIPEGKGPFPGLLDVYGVLVSRVESRAALLASHGYAVFAVTYMYKDHLPKKTDDVDPNYFKAAAEWFCQQEGVDGDRLGALGLCFGGYNVLNCAAICSKVKAAVNINGSPCLHVDMAKGILKDRVLNEFKHSGQPELSYVTDEGVIIIETGNCDEVECVPAWQHGAKILTIVGEDDKQIHPKWHTFVSNHVPTAYRDNVQTVRYPGAGHFIMPPYTPLCRVMNPAGARSSTVSILNKEFKDLKIMAGGLVEEHAFAQEDAWARILDFLHTNLKELKPDNTDKQTTHEQ